jgi:hypothetical protein
LQGYPDKKKDDADKNAESNDVVGVLKSAVDTVVGAVVGSSPVYSARG